MKPDTLTLPTAFATPVASVRLADLPAGSHAWVTGLRGDMAGADAALLQRLAEIGFVAGEPVHLLRRGPGGREPLAVQVGETLFALRLIEARCVEVDHVESAAPAHV